MLAEPFMEKRQTPRVSLMAEVTYVASGVAITKCVTDLGEGGLFIETPVPADVGTPLKVSFVLDGQAIKAEGNVVYTQPYIGMGVEFTGLSELGKLAIREYVARGVECGAALAV